jgi:ADP-ribose pyrophosphatase
MAKPPLVEVLELVEDYRYRQLFRVMRARLQYRRFDGTLSDPVTRLNFERGKAVGILLYDPDQHTVLLVRQFRYPVFASLAHEEQNGADVRQAWLLEIVAGVQEEGLDAEAVARKELLEEAGYELRSEPHFIATFYPSPGGSSESITLFWADVSSGERSGPGGGVASEGENTELVALSVAHALEMISRGEIRDAKTIIALQHLALLDRT